MKIHYIVLFLLFLIPSIIAQNQGREVARSFYSDPYFTLMDGIRTASKKHAAYAFIISNFSTADFDFMVYLPPEDQARLKSLFPEEGEYDKKVVMEFIMTAMAENSRRSQLFMTMYKGKKDSLSRIVTLGK